MAHQGSLRKDHGLLPLLPGPEALQLAIYVGYLKRRLVGGILAGLTFILPGAAVMILLSWLYVKYGKLTPVNNALYVLKPAVLGIIAAGIIKLGKATIRKWFLAVLLVGAFVGMRFAGINFLLILLIAGVLNLLIEEGWPRLRRAAQSSGVTIAGFALLIHSFRFALVSDFVGCSLRRGYSVSAVPMHLSSSSSVAQFAEYHWLTDGQLLDGVALSVATPGPFMLFSTFAGYMAGGVVGAILATFFVFLPSFVFVLGGAHYVEKGSGQQNHPGLSRRSQCGSSRRNHRCFSRPDPGSSGWLACARYLVGFFSADCVAEAGCRAGGRGSHRRRHLVRDRSRFLMRTERRTLS
jgi:chromate transporter